jgi:LPS-assembly protein
MRNVEKPHNVSLGALHSAELRFHALVCGIAWAFSSLVCAPLFAQELPPDDANPLVYYDADDVQLNRESGEILAQGNVFFLLGDAYISAQRIRYGRKTQLLVAEGDVKVLRGKERIQASRVVFDQRSREGRMDNVQVAVDPTLEDARLSKDLLGFTTAELAFETSRSERTKEMESELRRLRERYVSLRNLSRVRKEPGGEEAKEAEQLVRRYGQILERLARTRFQPNLVLDALPKDERERYQRRREMAQGFAAKNEALAKRVAGLSSAPGYVRIRARELYQTPEGSYEVKDANVTPCRCDADDIPLWGLSAREALIEPDEYVTLRGATADIASIPVGYTPWLKFPIKTKRQTGFLLPSFYASRSGEVFSIPFFLTLGEHADATVSFNQFSSRGQRYDGELRAQLLPESRLRLYGEYIADERYVKDYDKNAEVISEERSDALKAAAGKPLTTEQEDDFTRRLGQQRSFRYYSQDSLNVPVTAWGAAKADGEFVSDNRYLTDFGKEVGTTQDLFSPNQTARRFLSQEAAAEYYGNDVALSLRAQGVRDTFANETRDTPVRVPRVEFSLLPKRFFNGPVAVDANGTWERVRRLGGKPFADVDGGSIVAPVGDADETLTPGRNGRRDPVEPYLEGERSNLEGRLSVPLPANDYVNAYAGVRGVTTQYEFPFTQGWGTPKPYQTYIAYESRLELPMYGLATLRDDKSNVPYANVREDFLPAVGFTYIPEVVRSATYPKTYQLFYEQDDVSSKQELELSFSTSWTVSRLEFSKTNVELERLPDVARREVASQALFDEILEKRRVSIESSPEDIFNLSASSESHAIFMDWAGLELARYEETVLQWEFGKPYVWPEPATFRRGDSWVMKPLSLAIKTTYNFQSEKTANEKNEKLRPGDKRFPVEPWGDIVGTAGWSLNPFVPLSGALSGTWRRPWDRFQAASASVSTTLPYGFQATFSNSYTVTEVERGTEKAYPMERIIGTDLSWQPLNWFRAQYQRKVSLLPNRADEGELEYSALQKLSFLQLQDCLDITLQRFKDIGVRERYAVWSVGLNLRFLGQERNFDNAGATVNNTLQERARRKDTTRPPG